VEIKTTASWQPAEDFFQDRTHPEPTLKTLEQRGMGTEIESHRVIHLMLNYLARVRISIKIGIELRTQDRRTEYWLMIKEQMVCPLNSSTTDWWVLLTRNPDQLARSTRLTLTG
jgi:hypothetical protein